MVRIPTRQQKDVASVVKLMTGSSLETLYLESSSLSFRIQLGIIFTGPNLIRGLTQSPANIFQQITFIIGLESEMMSFLFPRSA